MEIVLNSKNEIEDIKFSGTGCAISQAAASMLTEKVKGMKKSAIMKLTAKDSIDLIGTPLTPSRIKCATLPLEVLQKAIL
jgi:nitrogen fixation protein NifU and related proteins